MADTHTRRLCVEIIHTQFGPLTAVSFFIVFTSLSKWPLLLQKLASVLLTRGRLPLLQLARFAELRPRTARASILILVQQNILWHTKGDDDIEMFEINVDDCLMRLRFGKFVWLANHIFGKEVRQYIY